MGGLVTSLEGISSCVSAIKGAIAAKGVSMSDSPALTAYSTRISQISTGVDPAGATAVASDVASGKTFYAGDSTLKTGTASRIPPLPESWVTLDVSLGYRASITGWLYYKISGAENRTVVLNVGSRSYSVSNAGDVIATTEGVTPVYANETFNMDYALSGSDLLKCEQGVVTPT